MRMPRHFLSKSFLPGNNANHTKCSMPVCVVVTFILKKYQEITPLLNIEILCPDALAIFEIMGLWLCWNFSVKGFS